MLTRIGIWRNALYARAAEIAEEHMGVVPVYFTVNTWATK